MASEATKMVLRENIHMDTRVKRMLDSNLRSYSLPHCSRVYRAIALLFDFSGVQPARLHFEGGSHCKISPH